MKIKIVPVEFALVVLGQDCNPTILNPDFLDRNKIIPGNWGWKVKGPPITTPPFATVAYNSGVSLIVDTSRFQIIDRAHPEDLAKNKVSQIAKVYIKTLPHVRYNAVGNNFKSILEHAEPDDFLMNLFIRPGPWNKEENKLRAVGVKLVYPVEEGKLTISLGTGTNTMTEGDVSMRKSGVFIEANFHRECQTYPAKEEVIGYIDRAESDFKRLGEIVEKVFS